MLIIPATSRTQSIKYFTTLIFFSMSWVPVTVSRHCNKSKSAQSNLGRGPRRRESCQWGGLITTAKVVGGTQRVYYAALASTDTVSQGFR